MLPGFVDTHVHYPQVRAIGGLGMPLLDWLEKCALPEEARLADASYAASVAADFVSGWCGPGPRPRWSSARTSRRPSTRCSPRPTAGRAAGDLRAGAVRPDPARGPAHHARARVRRGARAGQALARLTAGPATPSPRASRCPAPTRCWSRRGCCSATWPDLWFTSHLNENVEEIEGVRQLFGCDYATSTSARAAGAAQRARAQRAPDRRRAAHAGPARRRGRTLPDLQRGARQRAVPPGAAPGPRRPRRAGLRRRCRHRLLAVQGGAAGLLRASSCSAARGTGSRRGTCCTWPPPPARTRWGCRTRSATSRSARSSTPCGPTLAVDPLDVALRHAASPDDALAKAFALAGPPTWPGPGWAARA